MRQAEMRITRIRTVHYSKVFSFVGCALLLFCLPTALRARIVAGWKVSLIFISFALLGVYLILNAQTKIEMGPETITRRSVFGRHLIRWDEIKWIEHDPSFNTLVFQGANKRLVVAGPFYWVGRERHKLRMLMGYQIDQMGLRYKESFWSQFKFSKNVKMID